MKLIAREFNENTPGTPLFRELHPKVSVPDDAQGAIIDFRSSDETVDRYREVISAKGWKLDNYRRNPVVQNAHRYDSAADTIGKAIITEIRSGELFQRVQFAVDENPIAKVIHALYKGGFLSAVSVGFIPKKWEPGNEQLGYSRKFIEQELLEVSAVSIPANPNALKLGFQEGAIEKADLVEMQKLLKVLCTGEEWNRPAGQTDQQNAASLMNQVRELGDFLRR